MTSVTPTVWKSIGQVNTTDTGPNGNAQSASKIIGLAGGGFLVAWEDNTSALTGFEPNDVIGQRYDALGNKVGSEFVASWNYLDLDQKRADIIALPNGGFAVAYQTTDATGPFGLGDLENVAVEISDASGAYVRTDDFREGLAGQAGIDDTFPAVSAFSDGGYVLAYEKNSGGATDIVGYLVGSTGLKSSEFTIDTIVAGNALAPQLAALTGSLNKAYATVYEDATAGSIRVVLRNEAGVVPGANGVASSGIANSNPEIAALAGGGFVVVWQDGNGDGPGNTGIKARLYSSTGVAQGVAFSANFTTKTGVQDKPTVTALSDGGFVVTWQNGSGIKGQVFAATGAAVGAEFAIAAPAGATMSDPQISLLADGRFAVSFTATSAAGNDDVHAVIFDPRVGPVNGTSGADVLTSLAGGATGRGFAGVDTLHGLGGSDTLEGGAGADTLVGGDGAGKDTATYAGSNSGVTVNLATNAHSGGDAAGDSLSGIENLTGSAHADQLTGNGAANILNGGGGTDTLRGGIGNDIYVTDGGDIIAELANQGTDTVQSSVSLSLGSNLENLTLTGTAAINGTGNTLANTVTGNAAANVLNGGIGVDRLVGGAGNDSYIADGGDVIVEAAGQGTDVVRSTANCTLTANVETLVLTGAAGINGVGNTIANTIVGNTGANVLNGGLGNDILTGGAGSDAFLFNTALNASANVDRITDFNVPADTIRLDNAVMAGLGTILGTLAVAKFWKSTTGLAHDADDRIIYDTDSGRLFYDANGSAAGGAVHFATVGVNLALTNADFVVI